MLRKLKLKAADDTKGLETGFHRGLLVFVPLLLALRIAFEVSFLQAVNLYSGVGWMESIQVTWCERKLRLYMEFLRDKVFGHVVGHWWAMMQLIADFI